MLNASETWTLTKQKLLHLQHNDRAMVRQICNIKPEDVATVRSRELLVKLGNLDHILREKMFAWYGYVECSSGAVRTTCGMGLVASTPVFRGFCEQQRLRPGCACKQTDQCLCYSLTRKFHS